jgi:hypothetical protein
LLFPALNGSRLHLAHRGRDKQSISIGQLVRQIVGCTSTLAAWLGGSQDDRPTHAMVGLANDIDRIPVQAQIYDYHYALHWLHQHIVPYVMAALIGKVSPEHPDVLWKKFEVKFAGDVLNKRVLYGLQAAA